MERLFGAADRYFVRLCLVALLALAPLFATDPSIESVEKQKASIRLQTGSPEPAADSFFITKWAFPAWYQPAQPAAIGAASGYQTPDCDPIPPQEIDRYVQRVANREGFTPDLLRAVINQESAYYPCAVSKKGAQGLMQLMPETSADLGVADPFDPKENIAAGARYLGELLTRYEGNLELALGAYNAGPMRVDKYQGLPPIPETIDYVSDILGSLRESAP